MELEFTKHAEVVLGERGIPSDWVVRVVAEPERVESRDDGTRHFMGSVAEREGRVLRVIVAAEAKPWRVVTAFFDRRMRQTQL